MTYNKKIPLKSVISEGFWSEWGDSNSRHLAPKERAELFCNDFESFLAVFALFHLLSGTL